MLEQVEGHIAELEERLCASLSLTRGHIWAHLKGVSSIQVASLAAAMGDPSRYDYAVQVFRRSGLVSGRNDSGTRQGNGRGKHVIKVGDVYLLRALIKLVETLSLHPPSLGDYRCRLKGVKPHPGVARVATVRKATGILAPFSATSGSMTCRSSRSLPCKATLSPGFSGKHLSRSTLCGRLSASRANWTKPRQPDFLLAANQNLGLKLGAPGFEDDESLNRAR